MIVFGALFWRTTGKGGPPPTPPVTPPVGGHGSSRVRKQLGPSLQLAALIVSILTVIDDE